LLWVICMVYRQLQLEDTCVLTRLAASKTKERQWQVKLAEREVWCGRLARLEDGQWRYYRFDTMFYEKTLWR
jgi:hypothetical protein